MEFSPEILALLALAARVAGGLPEVAYPFPVAGHP